MRFIPDAIINYLILLGNSKATEEIFTLPEAIEWFNIENISKSEVKFDIKGRFCINHKKYSGAGFLAGTPRVSFEAASNFLYSGLRFSSS